MLSPIFPSTLDVFTTLVLLGFLLDDWIARRTRRMHATGPIEQRLIRAAAGGYFMVPSWSGTAIPLFLVALFLVWRPTCILAGLGVLALGGDGVSQYGLFHMTDSVFMLCLAICLVSLSLPASRLA